MPACNVPEDGVDARNSEKEMKRPARLRAIAKP
jgi:hypothetical protein